MISRTAVLFSSGLDSAVLLAHAARSAVVQPLYVAAGLWWEREELEMATELLRSPLLAGRVRPIVTLHFDGRDVYPPTHWAIKGEPPAFDTPDEDVYLEGRNIILLTKAAVFMARAELSRVLLGLLAGNPFPDASQEFLRAMERSLSIGLRVPITIETPFSSLHKADVIKLGHSLGVPFELTLSCMRPANGLHCGRCSKCRERRDGFVEAGIDDPTPYAMKPMNP